MAKVKVKGVIVSNDDKLIYDWFEMESTSPSDVEKEIEKANGADLEVEINSVGGDVYAGSEIYTALKSYKGNVTTKIVGIAASAASVIAMAGKRVLISPTAQIMIHNVSSCARGDYRDLGHEAEVLKNYNKSIASAYQLKSGMSEEELLQLMDAETWLTAKQALEYKLVDEVLFENDTISLVAGINTSRILPQEVIDKIRNTINNPLKSLDEPKDNEMDIFMQKKAEATLRYLKLKGVIADE